MPTRRSAVDQAGTHNPTVKPAKSRGQKCRASLDARIKKTGYFLEARQILTAAQLEETIASSKWAHYVYGLCDENGRTFYVGKGVNGRAFEHAKDAKEGDPSEKARCIRNLGGGLRYTIFLQCQDEGFALAYEASVINAFYDVLTNVAQVSQDVIDSMLEAPDPFKRALQKLAWLDRYVKKADAQCRQSMLEIIRGCPAIAGRLSASDRDWAFGVPA